VLTHHLSALSLIGYFSEFIAFVVYILVAVVILLLLHSPSAFAFTSRLSCAHKIQKRLYDKVDDEVLKLKNIHRHWLYIKSPRAAAARTKKQENHTMSDHQGDDESDGENIEMQGTSSLIATDSTDFEACHRQDYESFVRITESTVSRSDIVTIDSLTATTSTDVWKLHSTSALRLWADLKASL